MRKRIEKSLSLYLVTDCECLPEGKKLEVAVEEAVAAGVTMLQYRDKYASAGEMCKKAVILRDICKKYAIPFIVNDRLDVALAVKADGVHLGQDDVPLAEARRIAGEDFIIGISAHDVEEAGRAAEDGADYLGCGAVYPTGTKKDVDVMGTELLAEICHKSSLPVVAIGGIKAENYGEVLSAGAQGAAVVSAILSKENVTEAVKSFR